MFLVSALPIDSSGSVSGSVCLSVTVGSLKLVSGSRSPGVPGQAPSDPRTFVGAPPVEFVCSGDDDAGGWWWHTLPDWSA